jgi:prepilin-type N-terminal cleavage/methylation domain-containing protein/prepilin-type processing-associated H-X9-DG protein
MTKRNKGFTLIELLVVITIIAVLAAILFPVFLMARAKARAMSCIANLKQLGSTMAMYEGDWESTLPYTSIPGAGGNLTLGGSIAQNQPISMGAPWYKSYDELWTVKLEPYVNYQLIAQVGPIGNQVLKPMGIMKCKEVDGKHWQVSLYIGQDEVGYGYNFLYLGLPFKPYYETGDTIRNPYNTGGAECFVMKAPKLSSIKSPAETIMIVENASLWAFPPFRADGSAWSTATKVSGNDFIRPRHGSDLKTNVLWCDNHVTTMNTRDLVRSGAYFGDKYLPRNPTADRTRVQSGVAMNNNLWDTF